MLPNLLSFFCPLSNLGPFLLPETFLAWLLRHLGFPPASLAGVLPSLCRLLFLSPGPGLGSLCTSLHRFSDSPTALNPFSFLVVPTFCLERSLSSELWRCVFTCPCTWHLHVNVSHLLTQQVPGSHPILSRLFVFPMEVNCLSIHPAVKVVKLPHSFNHQLLSFPPYSLDPSTSFQFHPNATTFVSAMLTHLHLLFCFFNIYS